MLSYETLDAIADSINPTLGLVALVVPWVTRKRNSRRALALNGMLLTAIGIAYAMRSLDSALGAWSQAGLDFSTHTAVFVAIASSLWQQGVVWRWIVAVLGASYATLMITQDYHSWLEILSTALAMLTPLLLLWWCTARVLRLEAFA